MGMPETEEAMEGTCHFGTQKIIVVRYLDSFLPHPVVEFRSGFVVETEVARGQGFCQQGMYRRDLLVAALQVLINGTGREEKRGRFV